MLTTIKDNKEFGMIRCMKHNNEKVNLMNTKKDKHGNQLLYFKPWKGKQIWKSMLR